MPQNEGYVTTSDGIRLFFQTLGDGPRTVIVPNGIYLVDDFAPLAQNRQIIFYDVRNRGRSDQMTDPTTRQKGIHHDRDDLDAVRHHFGIGQFDLIGHSYVGITVALYAARYSAHVNRVVQIGPMPPIYGKKYPPHLTNEDATLRDALARLAELQQNRQSEDPVEFCRKLWSVLRVIYVVDPANTERVDWGRCELPNERGFMRYWIEDILPSIQGLNLSAADFADARMPVLIVHGTKDRSSAYGGGRDWALMLPNARLVTVDRAAHAPWIEAPEIVFGSIRTFLDGAWPQNAEKIEQL